MIKISKVFMLSVMVFVLMVGIGVSNVILDDFEDNLDANGTGYEIGFTRTNVDTTNFATGSASYHAEQDLTGPIFQCTLRTVDWGPYLNIDASSVPYVGGYLFHWIYQDPDHCLNFTGFYGWRLNLESGRDAGETYKIARYDINEGGGPARAAVAGWYQYWSSLQYPRAYAPDVIDMGDIDFFWFQFWNPSGTGTFMINFDTIELGTGPEVITVDDFDDTNGPVRDAGVYNITGPATLSLETTTVQKGKAVKITFPAGSAATNLDFGCWGTQFKFDLTQYGNSANDEIRYWVYLDSVSQAYPGFSTIQLFNYSEDWANSSRWDTPKPVSSGWTQIVGKPSAPDGIVGTGCNYGNLSRWTMQIQTPNPSAESSPFVIIFDQMEMFDNESVPALAGIWDLY